MQYKNRSKPGEEQKEQGWGIGNRQEGGRKVRSVRVAGIDRGGEGPGCEISKQRMLQRHNGSMALRFISGNLESLCLKDSYLVKFFSLVQ